MAWTAPMTAVSGSVFTASQFNTFVRDNLNESMVALATAAGNHFVASGVNSISERTIGSATVNTNETTSSSSYTNLATVGPTVTVTTGESALVHFNSGMTHTAADTSATCSFEVSGASTFAAGTFAELVRDGFSAENQARYGMSVLVTGLTPGVNVFQMKYKQAAGVASARFLRRHLIVIPL